MTDDVTIRRVMEAGPMPHNITNIEIVDVPDGYRATPEELVTLPYPLLLILVIAACMGLGTVLGVFLFGAPS